MGRTRSNGRWARLAVVAVAIGLVPATAPAAGICPIRLDYRSDVGPVVSVGAVTCVEELTPPANAQDHHTLRVEAGATLVATMSRIPVPGAIGAFELRMLTPAGLDLTQQMCSPTGAGGSVCRRSGAEGGQWTAIVRSIDGAAGPYAVSVGHLSPSAGPPVIGQSCEPDADASNNPAAPSPPPPTPFGTPFVCSGGIGSTADTGDWYSMMVTTSVTVVEVVAAPAAGLDVKIVVIRPNGAQQTTNQGQAGEPEAAVIPSVGQQGQWRIGIVPDEPPGAFPAPYTLEAGAFIP